MQDNLECCVEVCDVTLDKNYWDNQYLSQTTGWDLGKASPPLVDYFSTITNKQISILIPGCGNAYEADYLLTNGFKNITVIDISATLCNELEKKFNNKINIICGDFFELNGQYDLIIEQTFFCALPPFLRQHYVFKMHQLLQPNGKIIGLLFNRSFEKNPPFGGTKEEYENLFKTAFSFIKFDACTNSIAPRLGSELFFEFEKINVIVSYYSFNGITCNGCKQTVTNKFLSLPNVLNVSMSSNYQNVLIVSSSRINIEDLRKEIEYDKKYSIDKF
jgi:SAM-dependent methyltransferase